MRKSNLIIPVGIISGLLAAFLLMFAITGLTDHWGTDHWGDYATWLSGVATTAAVIVALWQTKLARDDAAQAKIDAAEEAKRAQEQFNAELKAADERLSRELDASRRMQQLKTIPPICQAIVDLNARYFALRQTISQVRIMPQPTEAPEELIQQIDLWVDATHRLQLACSTAIMMVSEPTVHAALRNFEQIVFELKMANLNLSAFRQLSTSKKAPPDFTQISNRIGELVEWETSIVELAREHFALITQLADNEK